MPSKLTTVCKVAGDVAFDAAKWYLIDLREPGVSLSGHKPLQRELSVHSHSYPIV